MELIYRRPFYGGSWGLMECSTRTIVGARWNLRGNSRAIPQHTLRVWQFRVGCADGTILITPGAPSLASPTGSRQTPTASRGHFRGNSE